MPRSCVNTRRVSVRTGALRLTRSGLRLVPENLAMSDAPPFEGVGRRSVVVSEIGSGQRTEWKEQRRLERLAFRPLLLMKYAPSVATDRRCVGLRTKSEEVSHCSAIELRPEGRRDSNPQPVSFQAKEPPPTQQADVEHFKERDSCRGIEWC